MSRRKVSLEDLPGLMSREVHFRLRPWRHKLHKYVPGLRLSSSQTDRLDYTSVCRRAAKDPSFFARFKSHPSYARVLEHVSEQQGQEYLDAIKRDYPEMLRRIDDFKKNDLYGEPQLYEYEGVGEISPTTLRYMKVAGDLRKLFGDLNNRNIIEIGSAYGGQCLVTAQEFDFRKYLGIDLKESLMLMQAYLNRHGLSNIGYMFASKVREVESDLLVSNYAFSECTKTAQDEYLEKIIPKAKRGYITYNSASNPDDGPEWLPYNRRQITQRLKKYHDIVVQDEEPQTGSKSDNFLITWNDGK